VLFDFDGGHGLDVLIALKSGFILKLQVFGLQPRLNLIPLSLQPSIIINFRLRLNLIMLQPQRLQMARYPIVIPILYLTHLLYLTGL
jgi:hypothetical protein